MKEPMDFEESAKALLREAILAGGDAGGPYCDVEDEIARLLPHILAAHREELVREWQDLIDRIEAFENRTPVAGEMTSDSFGSAGAGMERRGFKEYAQERIQALTRIKEEE